MQGGLGTGADADVGKHPHIERRVRRLAPLAQRAGTDRGRIGGPLVAVKRYPEDDLVPRRAEFQVVRQGALPRDLVGAAQRRHGPGPRALQMMRVVALHDDVVQPRQRRPVVQVDRGAHHTECGQGLGPTLAAQARPQLGAERAVAAQRLR